jgi:hypothetical protein
MIQAGSISANYAEAVPSDTVPLSFLSLWVGGGGNVAVKPTPGSPVVNFLAVPAGTRLSIAGAFLMATGTSATNIVALQ